VRAAPPSVIFRRILVALLCGVSTVATLAACSAILGLTDPAIDGGAPGPKTERDGGETASPTPDSSCSADLLRDPSHCGACDRSCLGGMCISGRCEPFRAATSFTAAYDVVGDATYLYLATSSGLVRLPRSDLAKWKLIAPAAPADVPERLARDGSDLYVRRRSNVIDRCTLPECSDSVRVAAGLGLVESLVVTDGFGGAAPIVWLDSLRELVGVPLPDAGVRSIATTNVREGALHVFGDAGTLYWSEDTGRRLRRPRRALPRSRRST
jgi:hypothetical protein